MGRTMAVGEGVLDFARTNVMGIVNVTPDSFYDGGAHADTGAAVEHGLRLAAEGADLLDVGGESTRPGSDPAPEAEELARVVPVVRELARRAGVPVSVDTNKAAVAYEALEAGAAMVNDISAGTMHPDILEVVAEYGVLYVAMHMRGTPRTMQQDTRYDDVVGEIIEYFAQRLEAVRGHGIAAERIVLDPGIGFGKPPEGNDEILARLGELRQLGYPLLVGPSRKSFLKRFPGGERAEERLPGTLAAVTICALAGVEIVRVHDVAAARQAVALADQVRARTPGGGAP